MPCFVYISYGSGMPSPGCSDYYIPNCPNDYGLCLITGEDRYGAYRLEAVYQFENKKIIEIATEGFSYRHEENVEISDEELEYLELLSRPNVRGNITTWENFINEYYERFLGGTNE